MKKRFGLVLFTLLLNGLFAEDYKDLLGLSLAQAVERLGFPDAMSVSRGKEPWMDDVVFLYPDGLSVYWYENRIWSAEITDSANHSLYGVKKGQSKKEILALKIGPAFEDSGYLYIDLPDQGWPSRLKIGFTNGKTTTVFLYRSDF